MKFDLSKIINQDNSMFVRSDLINYLINLYDYKSYLEIGVGYGGNFELVDCQNKIGVDPLDQYSKNKYLMTSDEFFHINDKYFDIIFIDGLHQRDQVIKDIQNSLKFLNPKGTIIMHDCLPYNEASQLEQPYSVPVWLGNVWEAFAHYRQYPDLFMMTLDTDHGLGFIKVGNQYPYNLPEELNYQYFVQHRDELMNVVSCSEALIKIKEIYQSGY